MPSVATAAFSGPWPTWIVATTLRVFGSIRETVFEPLFETQIALARDRDRARRLTDPHAGDAVRAGVDPEDATADERADPDRAAAVAEVGRAASALMWIRRPTLFVFGLIRST